jgi:hypothetical protein
MAEHAAPRLTAAEARRFGYTVGAAFLVLGGLLAWRGRSTGAMVAASLGGALVLGALVFPAGLRPVYRVWMGFAKVMSRVTNPVFMGVVYFLLLTPVGIVMRMLGKDPLARRSAAGSGWRTRPAGQRRSDLKRQF